MRWRRRQDKPLFHTHRSPFNSPQWAVGKVVQSNERLYQVTRWVELRRVQLDRGGSVGHWEVWGRELSDDEMRAALLEAVERIKDGDGTEMDEQGA